MKEKCEDEKMLRRCEDEKMFYRPPLLEEPCAQTLSGKKKMPKKNKKTKNSWNSIWGHRAAKGSVMDKKLKEVWLPNMCMVPAGAGCGC